MCLGLLCCCLGPAACGLCCCGGKVKNSITTRLLYLLFLVFVIVVSCIMLAPSVASLLEKAPILCVPLDVTDRLRLPLLPKISINNIIQCDNLIGYLAAYRVCMAVASFFFVFSLLMICVWSSKDPRSYVQNGFWLFKWLFVIGAVIGFFFIPDGQNFIFSRVSMGLGLAASLVFIVIQIIILVDFAHSWAESWIEKAEEKDSKIWYVLMLIFSVIFYFGSLVGIILLFVFFTEIPSCSLNKFFISSTLILSFVVSVVAILPWIQKVQPKSGLLQASVVTAYCTYVTWSAVVTEPYGKVPGRNATFDCQLNYSAFAVPGFTQSRTPSSLAATIVGTLILLITVIYICFRLAGNQQLRKFRGGVKEENEGSVLCCDCFPSEPEVEDSAEESDESENKCSFRNTDDEKGRVQYSYTFFHFVMMTSILFFMMQITNWADPGAGSPENEHFLSNWASTWVKMTSVWLCYAIYLWTLLAPLILGNFRDFGYE